MKFQLKQLLEKNHMTRYKLSRITNISFIAITKICNNETSSIHLDTIEAICHALNCTPNDLLVLDDPNTCSASSDTIPNQMSNKNDI